MKKISDNRVINIKIYVDGRSEEIQKKLFELGCQWPVNGKCVFYEDSPFLYVNEDRMLSAGNKMTNFARNDYREVKADEILAMKKIEEYKSVDGFKPFEKVLVRNSCNEPWDLGLFRRDSFMLHGGMGESIVSVVGGKEYLQCIPYQGNEHLAFMADSPDKE